MKGTGQLFELRGSKRGSRAARTLKPQNETCEGKPRNSARFHLPSEPRPFPFRVCGSQPADLGVRSTQLLGHLPSLSHTHARPPLHHTSSQARKDLCFPHPGLRAPWECPCQPGAGQPCCPGPPPLTAAFFPMLMLSGHGLPTAFAPHPHRQPSTLLERINEVASFSY